MIRQKKLGIFARVPVAGQVKTRLAPTIKAEAALKLYDAFLRDLFARLERARGFQVTVFYAGEDPEPLRQMMPKRWALEPQHGADLGQRMANAFSQLLDGGDTAAVLIGSDSPDLPLPFLKRAFAKLKHKDVVLGPAADGGYYLIGLSGEAPALFKGIVWGSDTVVRDTLSAIEHEGLRSATLPLWYDVDTEASLATLRNMVSARRIEKRDRLHHVERALQDIDSKT